MRLLYVAAHGGFAQTTPLGGGAAICRYLCQEWSEKSSFDLELIHPGNVLGKAAPTGSEVVGFSELGYARFCRDFEKAATEKILEHDPDTCIVLANDVSEGPNFSRLAEKKFRIFTIYHVDVVDYVATMYLRGLIAPQRLTQWHRLIEEKGGARWIPDVLQLIFQKQRDSVLYSKGLIVPSAAMREVLRACYPEISEQKIYVIPWGCPQEALLPPANFGASPLRTEHAISPKSLVLALISRISPEKGQDRLLDALRLWETLESYPQEGVVVFICGAPAFMQGRRFMKTLKKKASQLKRTRVIFAGFVVGEQKRAVLRAANVYVFPSRKESYGLTLIEAMAAGVPVITTATYGSEAVANAEAGVVLREGTDSEIAQQLQQALQEFWSHPDRHKLMGESGRRYAESTSLSTAAKQLKTLLVGASSAFQP